MRHISPNWFGLREYVQIGNERLAVGNGLEFEKKLTVLSRLSLYQTTLDGV